MNALSKLITGICDLCGQLRKVRMYVLQDGSTAWVCKGCRKTADASEFES